MSVLLVSLIAVVSILGIVVCGWFVLRGQMQSSISAACAILLLFQSLFILVLAWTVRWTEVKDPSPSSTPLVSAILCSALAALLIAVAVAHWKMTSFEMPSYIMVCFVAIGQVAIFLLASTFVEIVNGSKSLAVILKLAGEAVLIGAIINVASGTMFQPAIERLVASSGAMWRNHTVAEGVSFAIQGTIREFADTETGKIKDQLLIVSDQARNAWMEKPDIAMAKSLEDLREPNVVKYRLDPERPALDVTIWRRALAQLSPAAADLDDGTLTALSKWMTSRFAANLKSTSDQIPSFSDALRWHEDSQIQDSIRRLELRGEWDPTRITSGGWDTWRVKWLLQLLMEDLHSRATAKGAPVQDAIDYQTAAGAIVAEQPVAACVVFEQRALREVFPEPASKSPNPSGNPTGIITLWTAWLELELGRGSKAREIVQKFADPGTPEGREARVIVLLSRPSAVDQIRALNDLALSDQTPVKLRVLALAGALHGLNASTVRDDDQINRLVALLPAVEASIPSDAIGVRAAVLASQIEHCEGRGNWDDAHRLCNDLEQVLGSESLRYHTVRMRRAEAVRAAGRHAEAHAIVQSVRLAGLKQGRADLIYAAAAWEARTCLSEGQLDQAWEWALEAARCARANPRAPLECAEVMEKIITRYFEAGVQLSDTGAKVQIVPLNKAANGVRQYSQFYGRQATYGWVHNAMLSLSILVVEQRGQLNSQDGTAKSLDSIVSEVIAAVMPCIDAQRDARTWVYLTEIDMYAAVCARDERRVQHLIESLNTEYWRHTGYRRAWYGNVRYARVVAGVYPAMASELLRVSVLGAPETAIPILSQAHQHLQTRIKARGGSPQNGDDPECNSIVADVPRALRWPQFLQRMGELKSKLSADPSSEVAVLTLQDLEKYLDDKELLIDELEWCAVWEQAAIALIRADRAAVVLDFVEDGLSRLNSPMVTGFLCTIAQQCGRAGQGSDPLLRHAARITRVTGDQDVLNGILSSLANAWTTEDVASEINREMLSSRSTQSATSVDESGVIASESAAGIEAMNATMVYWGLDLMEPAREQLAKVLRRTQVQESNGYHAIFKFIESRIALRQKRIDNAIANMTDAMLDFGRIGDWDNYDNVQHSRASTSLEWGRYAAAIEDYEACDARAGGGITSPLAGAFAAHGATEARWRSSPVRESVRQFQLVQDRYRQVGLASLSHAVANTVTKMENGTYQP